MTEAKLDRILAELATLRRELGAGLPMLLTPAQAARELSVSLTTLKGLVRRREIRTVRVGRRSRVPATEIRRVATPVGPGEARTEKARSALQDPEALRSRKPR